MIRRVALVLGAVLLIWPGWAATKKKASSTKSTVASSKKKTTARAKKSSSKRRAASSKRRRATTWRNRQLQPTAERYAEIQRALADKGYLKGEPNGKWGPESVDALRSFQRDQNLEPSGKIDSVSLIALGLGPKYQTAAAPPSPSDSAQP
jgi:peptidoglycan hydrolase-like protein with peptidoglycan-binding domain